MDMQMPMPPPAPATTPSRTHAGHTRTTHPEHGQAAQHASHHAASAMPRTPIPPVTDADRAAAVPPPHDHPVHDDTIRSLLVFDRLEGWSAGQGTGAAWDGKLWIGTDVDRLWVRSEGEQQHGRLRTAELEVLYGHSVTAWWDVLAGVRHDVEPGPSQDFAAIGITGLAPYKIEINATAYVAPSGQTAVRFQAEYEAPLTARWILQPMLEVNAYGRDDARRGIGPGLSTVQAGVRLRYEITRRFAPYVGLVREQAFGRTAELHRMEGDNAVETRVVAGVRVWF